jgi:hypothetical protein
MTAAAEFDICNGEERIMAFESFDLAVRPCSATAISAQQLARPASFPLLMHTIAHHPTLMRLVKAQCLMLLHLANSPCMLIL